MDENMSKKLNALCVRHRGDLSSLDATGSLHDSALGFVAIGLTEQSTLVETWKAYMAARDKLIETDAALIQAYREAGFITDPPTA